MGGAPLGVNPNSGASVLASAPCPMLDVGKWRLVFYLRFCIACVFQTEQLACIASVMWKAGAEVYILKHTILLSSSKASKTKYNDCVSRICETSIKNSTGILKMPNDTKGRLLLEGGHRLRKNGDVSTVLIYTNVTYFIRKPSFNGEWMGEEGGRASPGICLLALWKQFFPRFRLESPTQQSPIPGTPGCFPLLCGPLTRWSSCSHSDIMNLLLWCNQF